MAKPGGIEARSYSECHSRGLASGTPDTQCAILYKIAHAPARGLPESARLLMVRQQSDMILPEACVTSIATLQSRVKELA